MNSKNTFRKTLILLASILLVAQLILIDYQDLTWNTNSGVYFGILSSISIIGLAIFDSNNAKKNDQAS